MIERRKPGIWEVFPGRGEEDWNRLKGEGFWGFGWYGFLDDLRKINVAPYLKEIGRCYGEAVERVYRYVYSVIKKGDILIIRDPDRSFLYSVAIVDSDYEFRRIGDKFLHGRAISIIFDINLHVDGLTFSRDPIAPFRYWDSFISWLISSFPEERDRILRLKGYIEGNVSQDVLREGSWKLFKGSKNIILYGPPGTGKTYALINKFAKCFISEDGERRYEFVSFHQSYSYEDFIEGWRPKGSSFELRDGIFKLLVKRAIGSVLEEGESLSDIFEISRDERRERFKMAPSFAMLIDEINRGNVPSIFGEVITLLDEDKRLGEDNEIILRLPYSGDLFGIPPNVFIIGTMNTVDRSAISLDAALRRRFEFEEFLPDYELLRNHLELKGFENGVVDGVDVPGILREINEKLESMYGKDYIIGHSYFMDVKSREDIARIFRRKIIPLLQEYFFDDPSKIQLILKDIGEIGYSS